MRGERGQATIEYAGLVSIIATVAVALVAVIPALDVRLPTVLLKAFCSGLDVRCGSVEDDLALDPCPVRSSSTEESLSATILSVRGGRADAAILEELSDGTATVTFLDRGDVGAEGGLGASIAAGRDVSGRGARAEASAALEAGNGRGYAFASVAEARAFLDEHASDEGLLAHIGREALAEVCSLCGPLGVDRPELPEPDFTLRQGGASAHAGVEVGLGPVSASAGAGTGELLGRRVDHHTGETTTYLRLTGRAGADISAGPVGAGAGHEAERVIEYTTAADGTPLTLTIRSARGASSGATGTLASGATAGSAAAAARAKVSGAAQGSGSVARVARLDLIDPVNSRIATDLIAALESPADAAGLTASARAVAARLAVAGDIDVRGLVRTGSEIGATGSGAVGVKIGGSVRQGRFETALAGAYSRPAGAATFVERTDCVDG